MNTTIKAKNRILSFALAVSLLLGMTLVVPGPVEVMAALPQNDNSAVGKPYDGIDFAALVGNGIYYGMYDHATDLSGSTEGGPPKPVLWRVMGEEADSGNLTLLSEYVLDGSEFHGSSHVYNGSTVQQLMNTMAGDIFQGKESTYADNSVTVTTRLHRWSNGNEESTGPDSTTYPATTTGQTLYLPWGKYNDNTVYWDAVADTNYLLSTNYSGNAATLKNGSSVSYWLRSPDSANSSRALVVFAHGTVSADNVLYTFGVRPAFQLNPSSVIFTSEIGLDEDNGGTDELNGYALPTAASAADANYKLTIVDSGLSINNLDAPNDPGLNGDGSETLTVAPGGTLDLTNGNINADNLVYKIVDRNTNEIVGYGTGTNTNITINGVANVTTGNNLSSGSDDYTLYVWAQNNNDEHSHEGSKPLWFKLDVADALDSDATLASVAQQPITDRGEAGDIGSPKTASISLGSSWSSVADSDLVTTNANATAELYDDSTYTSTTNSVTLDDPTTELYIKVTAEDTLTVLYYKITVTLDAAPSTPANLTIGHMEPTDTVEEGQYYYKSIPVDYQNGTALSLTYTVTGLPDGLSGVSLGYSGAISGTPDLGTAAGSSYTVNIKVEDGKGASATASYELTVTDTGSPQEELILAQPDDLIVTEGEDFVKTLSVTYTGSGALEYEIDGLPHGVTYNSATGVITGPADIGTAENSPYTVTVEVSDNSGNEDEAEFQLTVLEADPGTDPGPSRTRTRSSSGNGGSNVRPEPKTTLPATAFAWDGERTLTIDHERITPFGLLTVQWDGVSLTRGTEYSVYEGSVIVRFSEDFIAAQKDGEHTVRVEFLNHTGEATVTVGETGSGETGSGEAAAPLDEPAAHPGGGMGINDNPDTGGYPDGGVGGTDNPGAGDGRGIWFALLLGSLGGLALMRLRGKQSRN